MSKGVITALNGWTVEISTSKELSWSLNYGPIETKFSPDYYVQIWCAFKILMECLDSLNMMKNLNSVERSLINGGYQIFRFIVATLINASLSKRCNCEMLKWIQFRMSLLLGLTVVD